MFALIRPSRRALTGRCCRSLSSSASASKASGDKIREQVHPQIKGRKRFYKQVQVRPVAATVQIL